MPWVKSVIVKREDKEAKGGGQAPSWETAFMLEAKKKEGTRTRDKKWPVGRPPAK